MEEVDIEAMKRELDALRAKDERRRKVAAEYEANKRKTKNVLMFFAVKKEEATAYKQALEELKKAIIRTDETSQEPNLLKTISGIAEKLNGIIEKAANAKRTDGQGGV